MPRRALLLACLILPLLSGCGWIGAIAYYLRPPKKIDPEFKLTTGKVAIMIDFARPSEENPLFTKAFFDRFVENLETAKAPIDAIPLEQVARLRQNNADFGKWGVQRIGRELKAEQVIYIRVARLQLEESPGAPVVEPRIAGSIVVIGVDAPSDKPRLWPDSVEGREISAARQIREIVDQRTVDEEAIKLGKDLANTLARSFHEYDSEDKLEKEK